MLYRKKDTAGCAETWIRTDRFYCIFDQWFFSSRESVQHGPFPTKDAAELALLAYLRQFKDDDVCENLVALEGGHPSVDVVHPDVI